MSQSGLSHIEIVLAHIFDSSTKYKRASWLHLSPALHITEEQVVISQYFAAQATLLRIRLVCGEMRKTLTSMKQCTAEKKLSRHWRLPREHFTYMLYDVWYEPSTEFLTNAEFKLWINKPLGPQSLWLCENTGACWVAISSLLIKTWLF